jgi:hypothetical protein
MKVDADELIAYARTLEGQILSTRTGKATFTVEVTDVGMDYTPTSSGKTRHQYYKVIKQICEKFSETQSFSGRDYKSFTANASYVLALIDKYLNRTREG